jgi:hypothetical protein
MRTLGADDPIIASLRHEPLRLGTADWALAVPIVVHRTTTRIVLFGPHDNDEDLDRDEIRALRELAKAAATAYLRLEAEALRTEMEALKARLGAGPRLGV